MHEGILDRWFVLKRDLGFDQDHEVILDHRFVLGQDLGFD